MQYTRFIKIFYFVLLLLILNACGNVERKTSNISTQHKEKEISKPIDKNKTDNRNKNEETNSSRDQNSDTNSSNPTQSSSEQNSTKHPKSKTTCIQYIQQDPENEIYIVDSTKECSPEIKLYHTEYDTKSEFKPYVEYLYDDEIKSYSIDFHSNGLKNAIHILGYKAKKRYEWENYPEYQNKFHLSFKAKFKNSYALFVVVDYKDVNGSTTTCDLVYTPDLNKSDAISTSFNRVKISDQLPTDGKWHNVHLDLLADSRKFTDMNISDINGIALKGSGMLTDIVFSKN